MNRPNLSQIVASASDLDSQLTAALASLTDAQAALAAQEVLAGLEFRTDWIQDGNAGNTGGGSNAPHGTDVWGGLPFVDGWTIWQVTPSLETPYDSFYRYRQNGARNDAKGADQALEIMFPEAADLRACQSFECEMQRNIANILQNMAVSPIFADDVKQYCYFHYDLDQKKKIWIPTGIPIDFSMYGPGKGVTIESSFKLNDDYSVTHDTLTINGKVYKLGITQPGVPQTVNPYFNNAVQLNGNAVSTQYKIGIRNIQVKLS